MRPARKTPSALDEVPGATADIHDRLREVRVTGPMAAWFLSLMLGLPFAIAWALDDGQGNQPFPRGLRRLVLCAAAVHVGALLWRLLKAVRAWEPLVPIAGRLLGGYGLLAVTLAAAWGLHAQGVRLLGHFVLALPASWACYVIGKAMTPGGPEEREHGPG
jgi:hypothetical protein